MDSVFELGQRAMQLVQQSTTRFYGRWELDYLTYQGDSLLLSLEVSGYAHARPDQSRDLAHIR